MKNLFCHGADGALGRNTRCMRLRFVALHATCDLQHCSPPVAARNHPSRR